MSFSGLSGLICEKHRPKKGKSVEIYKGKVVAA
jgi:hypothetical protein